MEVLWYGEGFAEENETIKEREREREREREKREDG
jgi:hypothetical protein